MTAATITLNVGAGGEKPLVDTLTTVDGAAAPTGASVQMVKVGHGAPGDFKTASASSPLPVTGTVQMATLTKATQGATGVTTQDLKDAGRTRVSIVFQGVAPAVADTLLSLVKISNGAAAAAAVSVPVSAGKTLRIIAATLSIKSAAAAVAFATMTFRQNPAGATVIGSVSEFRIDVGNTAATIGASDKVEIVLPDGMEFSGTQTLGISLAAQAISNIISISLNGFEY